MKPLAHRVMVIGHRGAPAHLPEHTLASYARAIEDGADLIEPDLVMTGDGVLVSRHENEIGSTTDVAGHPGFAARRTTKLVDGQTIEGWFTEDFTLGELKTLRARERLSELRSTAHDGLYPIATLDEIITLAAEASARTGRTIGIIPEIKHGSYFRGLGLPMEDALLTALAAHPFTREAPVEIQSFEIGNLRHLHEQLRQIRTRGDGNNIRLLQLMGDPGEQPWDVIANGGSLTYGQMMRPPGLREVARYADAIGPSLEAIIPRDASDALGLPTSLVADAHAVGLEVHPYTFRPENRFLPRDYRAGEDPARANPPGMQRLITTYLDAGIDAFFTDDPKIGRRAVDEHAAMP